MSNGFLWTCSWLLAAVCFAVQYTGRADAQFAPPQMENRLTPEEQAASDFILRLPRDYNLIGVLNLSRSQIQNGEVTEALELLQQVLDLQFDYFLTGSNRQTFQITGTLRDEIDEILRQHREEYQRLTGSEAEVLLTQSLQARNPDALLSVIHRYGLTDAGATAIEHLARIYLLSGEPGLAARLYERLLIHPRPALPEAEIVDRAIHAWVSAGQRPQAARLLEQYREAFNQKLAREQRTPIQEGMASDWLTKNLTTIAVAETPSPAQFWRTPYGGIDQSAAASTAAAVLLDDWRVSLVDEYDFPSGAGDSEVLSKARTRETMIRKRSDVLAFPASVPLLVNGTAIVNRYGGVRAYDLKTGELKWPGVVVESTFHDMFVSDFSPYEVRSETNDELEDLFFTQRGWRDATAASMTADDKTVYCLVDCNLCGAVTSPLAQGNQIRSPRLPDRQNTLIAYELDTGRLKNWSVRDNRFGGTNDAWQAQAGVLSDVFFYSAPLPVHGKLYCLGEERGQTQLFELDPATGTIQWSLPLLNPQQDLLLNESRRLSGLMPSYQSGLLICPVGESVLTAVDIVQHRLAWTKRYTRISSSSVRNPNAVIIMGRSQTRTATQTSEQFLTEDRWLDNRLITTPERVVFAPPESRSIVCLNLADGSEAWSGVLPHIDGVYLAGVYADSLIVVDQHHVSAIDLSTGLPAWNSSVEIPVPSGRGVIMNGTLVQPTLNGSLVYVDLNRGQHLAEVPLTDGFIPGNLAVSEGRVVTQTGTELAAFLTLNETEQQIARQIEDPSQRSQARHTRGLLELSRGNLQQGIEDLRTSLELDPQSQARSDFVNTLLAALQADFGKYHQYLPELEQLIDSPDQKRELLRVKAIGLEEMNRVESFQSFLVLLSSMPVPVPMRQEQQSLSLREDLWILGRLRDLMTSSPEEERQQLRDVWNNWLSSEFENQPAMAAGLVRLLPHDWIPDGLLLKVLPGIEEQQSPEFISMTCHLLLNHDAPQVRLQCMLTLARLAAARSDARSLQHWFTESEGILATLPEVDQRPFAEQFQILSEQPGIQNLLKNLQVWPAEWTVGESTEHTVPQSPLIPIPVVGAVSPELEGWTFYIEGSGSHIQIYDPDGSVNRTLVTQLPSQRTTMGTTVGTIASHYVLTFGSHACIVLADRFVIVDLLHNTLPPRPLRNLFPSGESPFTMVGGGLPGRSAVPGVRIPVFDAGLGNPPGTVGLFHGPILCYGIGDEIVAIDVTTDEELWRRRGLPAGSEIIGDRDYLVLIPPDKSPLQILKTLDGHSVGSHPYPENLLQGGWKRAEWNRFLPLVKDDENGLQFTIYDPVTKQEIWQAEFPAGTRWSTFDNRDLGFLEPDGTLSCLDGRSGKNLFRISLPENLQVDSFRVMGFADQWILLTSKVPPATPPERNYFAEPVDATFTAKGPIFCIDRLSQQVNWTRDVENAQFRLDYPGNWPVLLFKQKKQPPPAVGGIQPFYSALADVFALQRNNGREIVRKTFSEENPDRWQGLGAPGFEILYRKSLNQLILVPKPPEAAQD